MIPKLIHQTFYTRNLPYNVQSIIENIKGNNTDFAYKLYDDDEIESFISAEFGGDIYSTFKKLNVGAAKSDLWRYCILYKYGGVYIDVDSEFIGKLSDFIKIEDDAIISRETHKNIFLQWCLIFSPNHPILEMCINRCVENILHPKNLNVLHLTGPVPFSNSVNEYFGNFKIENPWFKSDQELIMALSSANPKYNVRLFSTDFGEYCNFKHQYYHEIENLNVENKRPRHWSEEKKIFK